MKDFITRGLVAAAIALLASADVRSVRGADDRPASVVKYRQNVMKGLGNHMSAMSAVVKGEVSYADQLAVHAAGLDALGQLIPTLFPAGTGPDTVKSQAKAEVWTDSARFKAASDVLREESTKLVDVAKGHDLEAFKARYVATSKACGSCHDSFRVKE